MIHFTLYGNNGVKEPKLTILLVFNNAPRNLVALARCCTAQPITLAEIRHTLSGVPYPSPAVHHTVVPNV